MALVFTGTRGRSAGMISSIVKERKMINLKPAKKIVFKFDPFDERCVNIRKFMWHFNIRTVLKTNLGCNIKTEVVCDRSEPVIDVVLANGESILFKTSNLNELEIFQLFNKHITSLVPKEDPKATEIKTKTETAGKNSSKRKKN